MREIWVDAHLSPAIASWISEQFEVTAIALRDLNRRNAKDTEIFAAAKANHAIVMTKDSDFVGLVDRLGTPPQIIELTCGNTTNAQLKTMLSATLIDALTRLQLGGKLVEIQGR